MCALGAIFSNRGSGRYNIHTIHLLRGLVHITPSLLTKMPVCSCNARLIRNAPGPHFLLQFHLKKSNLFSKRPSHKAAKITLKEHFWSEPNANLGASKMICLDYFNTNMILHPYTIWKKQILVGDPVRNISTTVESQPHCSPTKPPNNNMLFAAQNWVESKPKFLKRKVSPVSSFWFQQENRIKLNLLVFE